MGGRGCTGQHRCASPCCCCHLSHQSGGETQHEPGQQQEHTPTQCPSHSTAPSISSTCGGREREPASAPKFRQNNLFLPAKQVSNWRYKSRTQHAHWFTAEEAVYREACHKVTHYKWVGKLITPTYPPQEGESTLEEATKDRFLSVASRLTCMGNSSTILIIPSPLDAKWKPSDRRTLATER